MTSFDVVVRLVGVLLNLPIMGVFHLERHLYSHPVSPRLPPHIIHPGDTSVSAWRLVVAAA